mgnify:CR=1 FL=1
MDLRLARPDQARLDFVEGLKVYVASDVAPALRTQYEGWVETAKPDEGRLRDRSFMGLTFDSYPPA